MGDDDGSKKVPRPPPEDEADEDAEARARDVPKEPVTRKKGRPHTLQPLTLSKSPFTMHF